ncbi:MAG: hypothetical protein U5R48_05730 [Gammaproteobacteria bacterium]|nr:hypothetical protein [Gammaproteobacteria bacterium]
MSDRDREPVDDDGQRYLEIVRVGSDEVVLQRPTPEGMTAGDEDALLRLRFSPEMLDVLGGELMVVAEAMVEAAADALDRLQGEAGDDDLLERLGAGGRGPTLH